MGGLFGNLGLGGLLDFSQGDTIKSPIVFTPYPLQLTWSTWAFDNKDKTKLLLGARGYGKTETVVLHGFIEELKRDPKATCLLVTRREDRAVELIETLGVYLKSQGFKGSFKQKSIRLPQNNGNKNPTIKVLTVNSTSFKGNHVDYVILDDPLDPQDEYSKILQRRVFKVYSEVLNIARKSVIVIGQPVTENDLYDILRMSVATREAWHGEIPQLDKNIKELRKSGVEEREIQKNYYGVLIPNESRPFSKYKEKVLGSYDFTGSIFMYIDPSFKGNDYTAVSVGCYINRFIAVLGFVFKKSWLKCEEEILEIVQKLKVNNCYYEDNGTGDALYLYFKNKYGLKVRNITNKMKKEARISKLEILFKNGALKFDKDTHAEYLYQVFNWEAVGNMLNDDAPDSCSGLAYVMGVIK